MTQEKEAKTASTEPVSRHITLHDVAAQGVYSTEGRDITGVDTFE
jgi:hypothetical protein